MDRFTGSGPIVSPYDIEDLELHAWFERDRQHVELRDPAIDETVSELVEDGFLDPSDWKGSLFTYARSVGILA